MEEVWTCWMLAFLSMIAMEVAMNAVDVWRTKKLAWGYAERWITV